ncbi:hypothetical protein TIFTF001_037090 [Ficus carica]|uniref:non-specific serine/threonine protein kinase n=1 Tax=Ficus carica TaxID=3494 RepID=A0AA88JBI4_FICCA|nr:hypothetical protein TIFTF001_037090 [Ficus carica]
MVLYMPQSCYELPFLLISLLIIFIFSAFPSSRCEEDANFTECGRRYECGNVKNLSFPFWGDGRPQSCGHPGFELRCERGEYPVIDIDEVEYRVLNVSQKNSTMILARSDLWDSPCSPGPVNTAFTPPFSFNYTQGVINLTLFYDCPDLASSPYNFTCSGDGGRTYFYNVTDFLPDINQPNGLGACGRFLQVPVFESALDEFPDQDGLEDVTRALREGFGLNYTQFPHCRQCEISGGRCGISDSGETFNCFCRNGTQELICPPGTAEHNGEKNLHLRGYSRHLHS